MKVNGITMAIVRQYTVSQMRLDVALLFGLKLIDRQAELGERHLAGDFWPLVEGSQIKCMPTTLL